MRPLCWLAVVAGLALMAAAAVAAPVVTNSLPQENEVVPAGKVHVELEFSEPMRDGAWSIVAADRGAVPRIVEGPEYLTPQILIMEVMTEPGKLYGIGFNSATKHNFVSMEGEPLEPFTIHFRTAGGADGADDAAPDDTPVEADDAGANPPVTDDGGADVPAPDAMGLAQTWRPGETQERIVTSERTLTSGAGDRARRSYTRTVRTSALQVVSLKGDRQITRARGRMVKMEQNRKGTEGAEAAMEPVPVPDLLLEAWIKDGKWAAAARGGEVPAEALQAFVDTCATGSPFAPPRPVTVGQQWTLEDAALRAAIGLLASDQPGEGQVTCRLDKLGEIKTRDGKVLKTAEITHAWTARIFAGNAALDLKGSGKSVFLLEAGKFISTEIKLSGKGAGGTASVQVTQRLRYFAKGQYPELTAGGDTETGTVGTDEGGALTLDLGGNGGQGGEPSLVGLWIVRTPEFALVLDVKPDGTYHRMVGSAEGNEEEDGAYRTGPGWLEITPKGGVEAIRLNLRFIDDKTVEITDDEGNGFRLVRQDLNGGGGNGQAPPDNGGVPPDNGGDPPDNGGGMGPDDDPWAEFGGDGEGQAPPDDGGAAPPDNGDQAPPDNGGGMGPDDDPWGLFEGGQGDDMGPAPDDGQAPPDDGGQAPPDNGGGMGPDDDPWGLFEGGQGDGGAGPDAAPDGGGDTPGGDNGCAPQADLTPTPAILAGDWTCTVGTKQISFSFGRNGTWVKKVQIGCAPDVTTTSGTWTLRGNVLAMPLKGQTSGIKYTVKVMDAGTLVFTDAQGSALKLVRPTP